MKKKLFFIFFSFTVVLSAIASVKSETFATSSTFSWRPTSGTEYGKLMTSGYTWYVNLGRDGGAGYMDFTSTYNSFNGYTGSIELCGRFTGSVNAHDTWAYLRSDSLTGGIDSLAFEWQASQTYSGHQLKFLVQVCTANATYTLHDNNASLYSPQETLSNDTVVYNLDSVSGTTYYAYKYPVTSTNPHHIFSCKNIRVASKFIIKITDFSYSYSDASGTIATAIGGSHKFDIANLNWKTYPPVISYNNPNNVFIIGTAIDPMIPINSGGAVVSYTISPTLPDGLTFDSSTGTISGIPTTSTSQTAYTITATALTGTETSVSTVNIAVSPVTALQTTIVKSNLFTINPTITSDIIRINTEEKQCDIKVYNYLGICVLKQANVPMFSVDKLEKGSYIIEIESNKGIKETYRFVKK